MTAEDLRKSILQQAIQGKLVPQDLNDEPAAVLLERIREEKARLIKEKKIKNDKNESIIFRGDDNSYYEKILTTGEVKCIDDEIPFEIPESWEWVNIGSLFYILTGAAFKKEQANTTSKGVRILRGGNILPDHYSFKDDDIFIDESLVDKSILLRKNDLITPAVTSLENVGKMARVLEDYNDVSAGGFVFILRPHLNNDVHSQYLCAAIQSPYLTNKIKLITKKSGSAFYNIGKERLVKLYLPIPPIEEQYNIIKKLSEIQPLIQQYKDAYIKLNTLNSEIKGHLKKSILQFAIQGNLVAQCDTDEPAIELLKRIHDEKLDLVKQGKLKKKDVSESTIFRSDDNRYYEKVGNEIVCIDEEIPFDIPESWEWVRFKNIVQFSLGKTPERVDSTYWNPNDFPWVSIADMEDKSILTKTKEFISQKALAEKFNNTFSPIGTLIMSFKLTIGKVSILGINAVHNEAIISIYPYVNDGYITRDYLYNFLLIITGYTSSTDAIKGATLNSKKISEMLVPLPPLTEQSRIVNALNSVLKSIEGI